MSSEINKPNRLGGGQFARVFLFVSALVFPLVLGLSMTKGLNHDEHQHVAAGALVAREGLLPYRDFPHFHTPYLPMIYGALFRFTDHLLLAGRLFSALSATAIVGLVGSIACRTFAERGKRFALLVCAGSVLLCLTAQLFTQATGRAWNHEPALFFALLAFVAHVAGIERQRSVWFAASGALLGLAIGTRITYAPLVAPFGLALALFLPPPRWKVNRFAWFGGGLLLGMSWMLWLFVIAPEQAFFANFEFAKVNIVYRFSTGEPRTMTLLTKLRFLAKLVIRPDFSLFTAGVLPCIAAFLTRRGTSGRLRFELKFILWLLPFLLFGSFAPSPLTEQYFYPFVPFMVLAGLYAFASIPRESLWFRRTCVISVVCIVLSIVVGLRGYRHADDLFSAKGWAQMKIMKIQRRAQEIRAQVPHGPVLTLAPVYAVEAGLPIYPSLSTGPFAWRVSPYVEPAKAVRLGMVTPDTLDAMLNARRPAAILTGFGEVGEEILVNYAREHGYKPLGISDEIELWIESPSR